MKCTRCGSELNKHDKFCVNCGQQVNETQQREQKKENIAKWFLVGSIIAVIIIAIIVVCIMMNSNDDNSNQSATQNKSTASEKQDNTKETTVKTENTTRQPETTKTRSQAEINESQLQYISEGQSQYDNGDYTILFGFTNKDEEYLWINASLDVKIINDNNDTVYTGKFDITEKNFATWSNVFSGDRYLASIVINENDITKGDTENGTIILNVTTETFGYTFENYEIDIDDLPYNSPSSKCSLSLPQLPLTINEYNWNNEIDSTIKIDGIEFKWEEQYDGSCSLNLIFSGEKTYGENGYTYISYKLYDSENYIVDSGAFMTDRLSKGDKFKNMEETIYSLQPGVYRLEITDYK